MADTSDLKKAFRDFRRGFIATGILSGILNIVTLTGSVYMLVVYDRVLVSRSVPTLIGISLLASTMFGFQALLEILRSRILTRIGTGVEEASVMRIRDVIMRIAILAPGQKDNLSPLRDLDQIRSFLASSGPTALFDVPWIPIYLGIAFAFHPLIGTAVLIGAIALMSLTLLTEILTKAPTKATALIQSRRAGLMELSRRNAEAVVAMGMEPHLARRFAELELEFVRSNLRSSDLATTLTSISRVARAVLQSLVLGLGAWLVIHQEASGGVMIASSIMTAKALGPVDLAISNWRSFVAARDGWTRLNELLKRLPADTTTMELPAPVRRLTVEKLTLTAPGQNVAILKEVSFTLESGSAVGIIGPSASGKSSLARALVGIWKPARGAVRLDGASLNQWPPGQLGRHIGYLPQDVELLEGTIAENIARFDPNADSRQIIAAAEAAGVHQMIVTMPLGYDTWLGEGGVSLSGGQNQRIALARALYGNPFLIVLDEPNSNLDIEGEQALTNAIRAARTNGSIVAIVAHRPSALATVDTILVMRDGQVHAFGPKDEILSQVMRRSVAAATEDDPVLNSPRVTPLIQRNQNQS